MSRRLERGQLLLELGRAREAASAFAREATRPGEDQALALALLTLTEVDQGASGAAASSLARARSLDPQHPAVRWAGAVFSARQADHAQMRADLLALRMDAPQDPVRIGLSALLYLISGDSKGALDLANEGLTIDPNETDCLHVAAAACATLGHHAQEGVLAERLIRLDPLHTHAHVLLARRALREQNLDAAEAHAREALRLRPDPPDAKHTPLSSASRRCGTPSTV